MSKFTEFIRIINSADDPLLVTGHGSTRNGFYAFSALVHLNIKQMIQIDSLAQY